MIVVTGALGFIGSNLIEQLNQLGLGKKIVAVDDFYKEEKEVNLAGQYIQEWIHRDIFLQIFREMTSQIDFVFHLGARTDTTEKDKKIFKKLNLDYSKEIWNICTKHDIPMIYASSAATYGNGNKGYKDSHPDIKKLKPLNPYGQSKQDFDLWALSQKQTPPFWVGMKFFNVYGPRETMKGRMASVIFHAVPQIKNQGVLKLFKSHKKGIAHGQQQRDFIFVKDVIDILLFFYQNKKANKNGIYNVGTGKARSFEDLGLATFKALKVKPNIEYIEMPKDLQKTYQYFTQANISKLRKVGYKKKFTSLEDGVKEYVKEVF
jgi:ADP-L-glycero-D-manno-heptose-6-epimerase